jgi:hypothetical protein
MLFTSGYGYVAFFVASEQLARKSAQSVRAPAGSGGQTTGLVTAGDSTPPPAGSEASSEAGLAA